MIPRVVLILVPALAVWLCIFYGYEPHCVGH